MADVRHWEQWINWRLDAQPDYRWSVSDWDAIASNEERMTAILAVRLAAATSFLIELMAEMAPRTSLEKLSALFEGHSSVRQSEMLLRARRIIAARDEGRSNASPRRLLSAAEAQAEIGAGQMVMVFLRQVVDPAGFTALARSLQSDTGTSASDRTNETRSGLYLALIEYIAFERSLPLFPDELLAQIQ